MDTKFHIIFTSQNISIFNVKPFLACRLQIQAMSHIWPMAVVCQPLTLIRICYQITYGKNRQPHQIKALPAIKWGVTLGEKKCSITQERGTIMVIFNIQLFLYPRHYSKCFNNINSFRPQNILRCYYYHYSFIEKETEAQRG